MSASGRKVVSSRAQIAAIVGNRIGKPAARLFAEPTDPKADGSVDWVDSGGETLTPVEDLPEEQGQEVLDAFVQLKEQIEGLASQMEDEGDAGQLAARILRLALVTPNGFAALHAAGSQPVLVNWGYAEPGQTLPGDPPSESGFVSPWGKSSEASVSPPSEPAAPVQPPPPPVEPEPISDPAADAEAETLVPSETQQVRTDEQFRSTAASYLAQQRHRRRIGPVAWLVPLLLLLGLGYVIWLLLQPLEPVVVEEELPPGEAVDPVPDAKARRDALLAQLEEATRMREGLAGLCVALPEREPAPVPQPAPDPVVVDPPTAPVEPPQVVEKAPEPDPVPPVRVPVPERIELPPEAPRAEDIPVDIARQAGSDRPQPTLCEPGWTPTQRPEVMVVIDGSGSMSESFPGASSRIDAARKATEEVVRSLHKDIRTGLVSFTDCNATSTPRKYRYSERPELISRVRGVSPTRGTSLANSIRRAGNAAKSGGPATVVVVSDGEDTCGGDPCAAARKLKAQKPQLKVNVIDLSGGRSAVLQCVASVTGGRVFTPRSASQMNEEMQQATGQPDASQCNG